MPSASSTICNSTFFPSSKLSWVSTIRPPRPSMVTGPRVLPDAVCRWMWALAGMPRRWNRGLSSMVSGPVLVVFADQDADIDGGLGVQVAELHADLARPGVAHHRVHLEADL